VADKLEPLTRLLSDPPDFRVIRDPDCWRLVKDQAGPHGLAPLVAFIARNQLEAEERVWCDRVLRRSWIRHERNLKYLEETVRLLDREGIRVLALKGPLLARRHYQPAFVRKSSTDLDFAVKLEDIERACQVLLARGYKLDLPIRDARARSHHVELAHPTLPRIELHFRLSHGAFGFPVNEFFERAVEAALPGGGTAWVLEPADELLHLVLHRAYGRFATLFHLYEIRRIRAATPDNVVIEAMRRAIRYHFSGAFAMTEIAFRTRWGEPFAPAHAPAAKTWLHWRITRKLYDDFERYSEPGRELTLSTRLRRRWVDFQATDRPVDALRFAAVMAKVAWYQLWSGGWHTQAVK
jgi:hypothetical protein